MFEQAGKSQIQCICTTHDMRSDKSILTPQYGCEHSFQFVPSFIIVAITIHFRKVGIGYSVFNKGGENSVGIMQSYCINTVICFFQLRIRLLCQSKKLWTDLFCYHLFITPLYMPFYYDTKTD